MKKFLLFLILVLCLDFNTFQVQERPKIRISQGDRQQNWISDPLKYGVAEGSCVHASLIMLLRYQGRHDIAEQWKSKYSGGETHYDLIRKLEQENIPYRTTYEQNNVEFLEWSINNHYGCMVTTGILSPGDHMIVLVHLDAAEAAVIDPNRPNIIKWMDREKFLRMWHLSHSWATTVLTPRAP